MDVNGGNYPNGNGSPIFPGTLVTGPLLAGNVQSSDGSGNLAALGETQGTSNVGYVVMAQVAVVTQASGATNIVIPAQSQIVYIDLMVTTAWTGVATTFGVGDTASATAFTTAGAANGATLGKLSITPGTGSTQIANWDNVGNTDVKINITSTNTGSGVGTLIVHYIQGINNAS
jgi:hypothetical protein